VLNQTLEKNPEPKRGGTSRAPSAGKAGEGQATVPTLKENAKKKIQEPSNGLDNSNEKKAAHSAAAR